MTKLSPKTPSVVETLPVESRNGRKEAADTDPEAADRESMDVVMAEDLSSAGLRVGVRFRRLTTPSSENAKAGAVAARVEHRRRQRTYDHAPTGRDDYERE